MTIADDLRSAGVPFVYGSVPGRPGGFSPVGIIIHHTAGKNDLGTVRNGRPDLPGPLSHLYFDRDATHTVTLVSEGRANHAGGGSSLVLDEVKNGRASGPSAAQRGLKDSTSGNEYFIGFECENLGDGEQPWPGAQMDIMVRSAAAICKARGWTAGHIIGHLEWTRRKVDPRGFSMDAFRSAVAALLAPPAPVAVPPATTRRTGMTLETIAVPLPNAGAPGKGHIQIAVDFGTITGIVLQGLAPERDGYPLPAWVGAQPDGPGKTRIVWTGLPDRAATIFVKVLRP